MPDNDNIDRVPESRRTNPLADDTSTLHPQYGLQQDTSARDRSRLGPQYQVPANPKTAASSTGAFTGAVADEGTALTVRPTINFTGAGVAATDDAANNRTNVAISGAPSGAAGGVLSGTYPNPGFAVDMATQAELDAEAALARNADNLTSGTVADARIASTIARDSEVTAAITTHEAAPDPHTGYVLESVYVAGHVIEDEGTPVTQRATINYTGAGVSVTDSGGKTVVTIGGGGSGGDGILAWMGL